MDVVRVPGGRAPLAADQEAIRRNPFDEVVDRNPHACTPVPSSASLYDDPVPAPSSAQFVHLVDQGGGVGEVSLRDRLDPVEPEIALVAGVEQRGRVRSHGVELEAARVGGVDDGTVVGLERHLDVQRADACR